MKKALRFLSILMILSVVLCGCGGDTNPTSGPTTTPTTPPPVKLDANRALPVLPEKFVSHDANPANFVIAEDGEARAIIVVPAGDTKAAAAAADLSSYLTKITGATFETVEDTTVLGEGNYILVGPTAKTKELGEGTYDPFPNDEGYTIRRQGNFLILCGNDSVTFNGTQFAVTRLLEEAGCGWFTMDALWQVVPETANLSVKTYDKDFEPRFETRSVGATSILQKRWYCGGYSTLNGHALPGIVPASHYAQTPEYFALVDGNRDPSRFEYWHYCYTNPDFAAVVAASVCNSFRNNPTLLTYSITANDGWDKGWCECDTCTAAGNHADVMLTFANNVAAITSQEFPDRTVNILAYHSTFIAPENTVKAHPNVEIMFCLETAPFEDLSKDQQIFDGYHSTNHVVYTQSWKDNCAEWMEKTDAENVSIWMWYCIGGGRSEWRKIPWVQGNTISNNLDLFEQMGVREIYVDAEGLYDLRWPLYYAAARCMWNEDLTAEQVLYDACIKLYGDAAEDMFLYYRHLADAAVEHGCTKSSIVWVPPLVFEVYYEDHKTIHNSILAAMNNQNLTLQQAARVKNQNNYWMNVLVQVA